MSGVSSLGPLASPQLNNSIWVGSILYGTIQSAVTAGTLNRGGAMVIIPWGATPSDTIAGASGTTLVNIRDLRTPHRAGLHLVVTFYLACSL